MATPILTVTLSKKRDLLLARQRGRQIASLLGYDAEWCAVVAAQVFELASVLLRRECPCEIVFQVTDNSFEVFPRENGNAFRQLRTAPADRGEAVCRLDVPLPRNDRSMTAADASWIVGVLGHLAPFDPFEEIEKQNREFLDVMARRGGLLIGAESDPRKSVA
jgi:hypothetical protein